MSAVQRAFCRLIHSRPRLEQDAGALSHAILGCDHEHRFALTACLIWVSPRLEQDAGDLLVTIFGREHQGGHATRLWGVDGAPALRARPARGREKALTSTVEPSSVRVHVGPRLQQCLDDARVSGVLSEAAQFIAAQTCSADITPCRTSLRWRVS